MTKRTLEGYAVTVTYTTPFAYVDTLAEAKAQAEKCRAYYPKPHNESLGSIWRLWSDGTRTLARR